MGDRSRIQWTDATWSPLRARVKDDAAAIAEAKGYTSLVQIAARMAGHVGPHCEHVSDGCKFCYSGTNNHRCLPSNGTGLPFDRRSRDLINSIIDDKAIKIPLRWHRPRKIFVENQSDLFGEWVTDDQIDRVLAVMALSPQHTFQVLTKRPGRMHAYFSSFGDSTAGGRVRDILYRWPRFNPRVRLPPSVDIDAAQSVRWPLPNVWLGVSVENQATADDRIPILLRTPAAKRFVSYEPALGPVSFARWTEKGLECWECAWTGTEEGAVTDDEYYGFTCPQCAGICAHTPLDELLGGESGINWIIVGGESGHGARPFDVAWARSVIAQCKEAGVACFVKQLGANVIQDGEHRAKKHKKGGDMDEWPHDLRVRQFPSQGWM